MKKIIEIFSFFLVFIFINFSANAACKFELEFGDDASKVLEKYGPPMPMEFEAISIIPVPADDICPEQNLKEITIEYRFLNEKLAAINLIAMNDETNSASEKLTLMNYVKRFYGKFDSGQNPKAYIGYEVFEKGKYFVVYQRIVGYDKIIDEQIYISNDKYDKLLAKYYNKAEESLEEAPKEEKPEN